MWVFGSALTTSRPRDLDILIVYDRRSVSISSAIRIRRQIQALVLQKFAIAADVVLLSRREAATTKFSSRVRAVRIF
jgi:hypothetical protein